MSAWVELLEAAVGENWETDLLCRLMPTCHYSSAYLFVPHLSLPLAFWSGVSGCATPVPLGHGALKWRRDMWLNCSFRAQTVSGLPQPQLPAVRSRVQLQWVFIVLRSLDSLKGISFIWVEWAVNKFCSMLSFSVINFPFFLKLQIIQCNFLKNLFLTSFTFSIRSQGTAPLDGESNKLWIEENSFSLQRGKA